MAKQEWGEKRACQTCGKNFYDMLRFPIACPECGAAFTVIEPMTRRGPARTKGRFFAATREAAPEGVYESGPVAEEAADDGESDDDGEGGEKDEDDESVADEDDSVALGKEEAA